MAAPQHRLVAGADRCLGRFKGHMRCGGAGARQRNGGTKEKPANELAIHGKPPRKEPSGPDAAEIAGLTFPAREPRTCDRTILYGADIHEEVDRVAAHTAMANRETTFIEITPEVLLKAYACGIFPMAESADDPALYWIEPEQRGIIPLDHFHVPERLAKTVRADRFTVAVNRDFDAVIAGCADPQPGRPRTWINARIRILYRKLYERRTATPSRS
jgi:hypothetical protein